ncbi:MAG: hypothetical protein ACT4N2_05320 [Hyphomicrobium sp.]
MQSRLMFALFAAGVVLVTAETAIAQDLGSGLTGTNVGTVGGAVVGGIGGHYLAKKAKLGEGGKVAATIGGTLAGGVVGNVIGRNLDAASRQRAELAQRNAIETGSTQRWEGQSGTGQSGTGQSGKGQSGTGPSGRVQPGHPYATANGICRDYLHTVSIEGRSAVTRGVACRNPDGTWRVQN